MGKILNDAIIFATQKHSGAVRKGTTIPYIIHPMEAATIAASITEDEEILAAAVLHDTLEDTDTTKEEILERFGSRVLELVISESEDKMTDRSAAATWKERKQATIDGLDGSSLEEQILVLSDKLSNLRTIHRDYDKLGEKFWERFNQKDKKMHAWYYTSIAEKLDKVKETAPYCEYISHLKAVFDDSIAR